MKMVKSLLLGSAAGVVAVVGAQAADLPVKAKPVEYVKICSLYGAGFYYIPGTDTCLKIGSYLRVQHEYGAGGGGISEGSANGERRNTRTDTNLIDFRTRFVTTWDFRTQTSYGTLRSYTRFGVEQTTPAGAPSGAITWDRAFIQFAGFTVGRAQSFFDIYTFGGAHSYHNVRTAGDTGAAGVTMWAYTAQLGNGVTLTGSLEDPGGHNRMNVYDLSVGGFWGNGAITPDNGLTGQSATMNGFHTPDIIGNARVDQAWGYLGVSGVAHRVSGAYYGTPNSIGAPPNTGCIVATPDCGAHPSDRWGWAGAVGGLLNIPGMPGGSIIGANFVYARGATGYVQNATWWQMYSERSFHSHPADTSIGLGWASDGVFDSGGLNGNTNIELTRAWSANAAIQLVWSPGWRTSVFGGYVKIDYTDAATALINSHLPGPQGSLQTCGIVGGAVFSAITPLPGNSCNPDFSFWQVGTRTQWNPARNLDLGVQVMYTHLNTAYEGPAIVVPSGARPAVFEIDDQHVWSVMVRAQTNFYP